MSAEDAQAWAVLATGDGSWTLVHPRHGEACHSRAGAWTQARERYARPCALEELARARGADGEPVRLLDVGTGPGLNLAAALEAVVAGGGRLDATALELELAPLRGGLAAGEAHAGPAEPFHAPVRAALRVALRAALAAGAGRAPRVPLGTGAHRLWLLLGDARATLLGLAPDARFDAIFLDPFSPRVDPALWEPAFLAALARRLAPGGWLSTYTASFRVRLGLARGGLAVGRGPRVGAKAEGTLASPDREPPALAPRTARRLARALAAPSR